VGNNDYKKKLKEQMITIKVLASKVLISQVSSNGVFKDKIEELVILLL